jgi:hypothetical protein
VSETRLIRKGFSTHQKDTCYISFHLHPVLEMGRYTASDISFLVLNFIPKLFFPEGGVGLVPKTWMPTYVSILCIPR